MNILIIGSGGHAGVVIHTIEAQGKFNVVGLVDDYADIAAIKYGHSVLGRCKDLDRILSKQDAKMAFIAVGGNAERRSVWNKVRGCACTFPHVIHPDAVVFSNCDIGIGSLICAGAVLTVGSKVGRFTILNTNSSLDHDSEIGDFSHMAPNSATGGNAHIGDETLVGIGACIRDRVRIGSNCIIGMGSTVVEDMPDHCTAYGNPCRIKSNEH